MKTKIIKLYTIHELSEKAKKKALENLEVLEQNSINYFLPDEILEQCVVLLKKHKIHGTPKVHYSLNYCQGDGCMFEGTFKWKCYEVFIAHSGNYYHYNSKIINMSTRNGSSPKQEVQEAFNDLYVSICKELEKYAYSVMEESTSEEALIGLCDANEYFFRENGTMEASE